MNVKRKHHIHIWTAGVLSMLIIFAYGCRDQYLNADTEETAPLQFEQQATGKALGAAKGKGGLQHNFRTHLKGENEVPAVETNAQGQAIFKLSRDGETLHYKLIVANIENVMMAHIHNAPAGVNGGVVVWLYPDAPPPQPIEGRSNGVLATGTITADNLVGSLEGQSLDDLLELIRSGDTYVNVHTTQNPGGEVRGQIR